MKILVISDTHGSLDRTIKIFSLVENPDLVFHIGDILYHGPRNPIPEDYNPSKLAEFLRGKKIKYVRGNCDADVDIMLLGLSEIPRVDVEYIENFKILMMHGDQLNENDILDVLKRHKCNVLIHGHTHIPKILKKEGFVIFNPGSPSIPKKGNGSFGVIEIAKNLMIFKLLNMKGDVLEELTFSLEGKN